VKSAFVKSALFVAGITGLPLTTLMGQVGYEPQKSPFRDLETTQEVTVFTGFYRARKDPAGVAPQSGPMAGLHYQWRAGGPANLTATLARVASERRVLDPEKPGTCAPNPPADCKLVGVFRWPLYFADVGVAVSLTGARSFYRLVPDLKVGAGLASDFHTQGDVGEFGFGTRFALRWGAGIRWIPVELFQVRADFTNYLYSVRYPESYYVPASDNSQILPPSRKRTAWMNNPGFTIGLSYLFSR
jgi:hypothetical protein